jgi:hypothetical protein
MHAPSEIDRTRRNMMGRGEGGVGVGNLKVSEKEGERKSRFSGTVSKSLPNLGFSGPSRF